MTTVNPKTKTRVGRKKEAQGKAGERIAVTCAFCHSKGRDPFGIISPLSTCQVCGGTGRRTLRQPTVRCAYCRGTGVHPGTRMTCTTCHGVGTVPAPADAVRCPCCGGTGWARDWPGYICSDSSFSCPCCGGKGVVAQSSRWLTADSRQKLSAISH